MLALLLLGSPSSQPSAVAWGAPAVVEATALQPGPNSLTERQVRERLAAVRCNSVRFLRKDGQGIWRGLAWHAGREVAVAMDARGRVAVAVAERNPFLYAGHANARTAPAARGGAANRSGEAGRPLIRQGI